MTYNVFGGMLSLTQSINRNSNLTRFPLRNVRSAQSNPGMGRAEPQMILECAFMAGHPVSISSVSP